MPACTWPMLQLADEIDFSLWGRASGAVPAGGLSLCVARQWPG
ncbi:hypothetical protein D556_2953 [Bordetella holmesii 41130]|nr:hypothetical protein D558_2954 [Bordetella holmesii 44057]EWM40381.1 hypothetical protein D555_3013 [Bordetella holmesii 35009]EWM42891.1 hypothetical protein D556_2953 [Bordetella holmesii 41130]EWM49185.1 hypothetical protein D557_2256 [Bordetella holmesii 70147]KCV05371.1 hypothetical protein L498_1680 [Bordetella holmesii CDC-H629-BH]